MTIKQLFEQLKPAFSKGSTLDNPGGGITTITGIGEENISYIRGASRMYLPYAAMVDALNIFADKTITTTDLKDLNPAVFDSKKGGHSCNCTVMFCILERMGLIDSGIKGSGRRGSPFSIKIR